MVDVDTPPYADEVPRGESFRPTKAPATRRGPIVVAVLALVVAIVAATVEVATPASRTPDGERLDVAAVVAAVKPSVVSIETEIVGRRGRGSGAGTGVVIHDGLVLTNAHVIDGADRVTVTGADGRARDALIVAGSVADDIAVLRVRDATGLVPATLGTDDTVAVGDDVVAIGNALALEGGLTVTRGIVSALDRSIETGTGTLTGLVQTDAAISSGNSGGALVNAAGHVIGINTAVAASGGPVTASNIGFAISIDHAMATVERLLEEHP